MTKSPRMGFAKRRLGREVGDTKAIRLYRSCLSHTVLRLAADPRWRALLAIAPDADTAACLRHLARRLSVLPQGVGDLGQRMQRLFAREGPGPLIIVGSDIPSLRPLHVARAFKLLAGADAVFGPAPDGGYWLVGLRRCPRLLAPFARVRWSSAYALSDTLANLREKTIAFAETLDDIDSAESYRAQRSVAERVLPLAARVPSQSDGGLSQV
jgi:rSAM/selenodomain-associated transferase 1